VPAGLTIVTKAPQQNISGVRGALANITLPYAFLCYGSPCESAGVSCACNRLSAVCLNGTPPLGIDIVSTEQQHFVLLRRFSLDRYFTVVYIASSDVGSRDSASGRPIHPGNTASRLTQPDGLNRDIERGAFPLLHRRRSPCCRRGIAQIRRRSEWLSGYARGAVFVFRCFEISGESNLAAAC
jgi:hypothetical protein